jgi:hypothetical protein
VGRSIQPRKREEQPRENTREEKIMSLGSLRRYSKAAILAEMHLARRWQGLLQKIDCLFLALLSCGIYSCLVDTWCRAAEDRGSKALQPRGAMMCA